MGDPARRFAGYQDVLEAPRHTVAEVLGGQLHLFRTLEVLRLEQSNWLLVDAFADGAKVRA